MDQILINYLGRKPKKAHKSRPIHHPQISTFLLLNSNRATTKSPIMSLQRLRRLATATAPLFSDGGLLLALRSELNHELTHQSPQEAVLPTHFSLEYDVPSSQDVLLRRRDARSGEEVVVSALLGPLRFYGEEETPSQDVLMKVCVQKLAQKPVVRFDCCVFGTDGNGGGDSSDFDVRGAWYHSSVNESEIGRRKYLGPKYSTLNRRLQQAFKEYLVSRGITTELTDFLLKHLHNKEQSQYVNWLRILEAAFSKDS